MNQRLYLLFLCLLSYTGVNAQAINKPDHDTTYYRSFKGTIIGRLYLSRSYLQFKMEPPAGIHPMSYPANKPLSLGIGLT